MNRFEVVVVEGLDLGRTLRLGEGGAISIGRAAGNDLVLADDHVSRNHARIECVRGEVCVVDLESRSGVHVNGVRVTKKTLAAGDTIKIGRQVIYFRDRAEDDDPSTAAGEDTTEIGPDPRVPAPHSLPVEDYSGRMVVGSYRILDKLAEGGLGTIFIAGREGAWERFALKVLRPGADTNVEFRDRFAREVRLSERLVHPHIVRFVDSGWDGAIHYLVSELVRGRTIADILQEGEPIEIERTVRWATEIASALVHAHELRIIHRDLSPANVLIEERTDRARVLDFGLGRAMDQTDSRLTFTGQTLGTVQYASPEQIEDAKRGDERADIYGLGAILYALLTGLPPFSSKSRFRLVESVLHDAPRPIPELRPDAPPWLVAIVDRALDKSPDKRFLTARQMQDALSARTAKG